MRSHWTGCTVIAVAALAGCGRESAGRPAYEFTELTVPGADVTVASGINDDRHVVGWYHEGDRVRGFIYRNGAWTTVDYPGAALTQLQGIGPDGEIVGVYRKPGEPKLAYHGFRLTVPGDFVEVNHPDHKYSFAQRILGDGTVLGCYHGDDFIGSMRGVTFANGKFDILDVPATMHNGATPDGRRIVGLRMDTAQGYILEDGKVTYLVAPASTATEAWDINASGVIVGTRVDSASVEHGFVFEKGAFTALDVPSSKSTIAFGINASGDIVGGFDNAEGKRRAFIARRGAAERR